MQILDKRCTMCRVGNTFYVSSKGIVPSYCTECSKKRTRNWEINNPEKRLALKRKWRLENPDKFKECVKYARLKTVYGVNKDLFKALLEKQNGLCIICGISQESLGRSLSVDHCHLTGKIRGLLCGNCNSGLGQFKDKPDLLLKAHRYLTEGY